MQISTVLEVVKYLSINNDLNYYGQQINKYLNKNTKALFQIMYLCVLDDAGHMWETCISNAF